MNPLIILFTALVLASTSTDGDTLASAPESTVTAPVPPARSGHTTIYDPVRRRLIVFGGDGASDVWALSLGQSPPRWTELAPTGIPPRANYGHTAIYDPKRHRMIVFGGVQTDNELSNEVWALSLSNLRWRKLNALGIPPAPREWHSAIYDPVRDRMIVHGGWTSPDGVLDDVWALDLSSGPTWSRLLASPSPPGHRYHSALYDERRDRMLVFSGSGRVGAPRVVWSLSLSTGQWTALGTTGCWPPGVPYGRPAFVDAANDRMIVDGGVDGGVWFLSLESLAWSRIVSFDAPIPRDGQTATFDPVHRQMIVFGGYSTFGTADGTDLADSWAFDVDARTWSEVAASGGSGGDAAVDDPHETELAPVPSVGDLVASRGYPFFGRDGRISTRLCIARGFVRSRSTTISPTSSGWSAQPCFAAEPLLNAVATLPGMR